jgi:hypothetical protein
MVVSSIEERSDGNQFEHRDQLVGESGPGPGQQPEKEGSA